MQKPTPNNHVANTSVYLFDSIVSQDTEHLNRLRYAIAAAIKNAYNSANKTLSIYVDCPDTVIDERFQAILNELYIAAQGDLTLHIVNAGAPDSTYVRVLESLAEAAKMPPVTNSPFHKRIKQH